MEKTVQDGENGGDGLNGGNGGNGGNSNWGHGGDGGNGGNSFTNSQLEQANGEADEWEYKILKDVCRKIIDNTISQVYSSLSIVDHENVLETACKQNISVYLLQIGTPAAQKLWKEYDNIQWRYPAIVSI
ncbi:MAG: hypothetical protein LVR00_00170 [Rhabdochlamydiaceae bacterium]